MNNNLVVVNDYNITPIPLQTVKSFLRVTSMEDDSLIALLLKSAINYAENKLGIVIGRKEYCYNIYGDNSDILLPRFPILQINSVKVDGIETEYKMVANYLRINSNNYNLPVKIRFTCENMNFGDSISIAILRHVFFLYENRSVSDVNSKDIESIYQSLILNNYNI
jgi:hypothetical protein